MNAKITFQLLAFTGLVGSAWSEKFPLNEKAVPDSVEDLQLIESTLKKLLPAAQAATVCVQIGGGSGSGVVVSPDGLVMTAAHVATGVGKDVEIVFLDGTKMAAKTLGLMAETDAALIQITDARDLPYAEVQKENEAELGDWLFSTGHPGGFDLERGPVSRVCRLVRVANRTIQTDGPLIGGDSGGPLFDMEGKVVGINSRVGGPLVENAHVPAHVFLENWDAMLASEFIGDGSFAQKPEAIGLPVGLMFEMKEGKVAVKTVIERSPAAAAGFQIGDTIVSSGETEIKNFEDFGKAMMGGVVSGQFPVQILRDGVVKNLIIKSQRK